MSEVILEQIVDELMQLGEKKFFKTILMINAVTEKTKEINKENADLHAKLKAKDHTIELANGALKRAGSAARFGLKVNIPEDAMIFSDTAESLASIPDVYCGCEALHQAQDRERLLRESILKFMDEFCSNFRTMDQRATVCYPPDEGKCGNYDACRELNKILAYNEKPTTIISVDAPSNIAFTTLVNKFNKVL